NTHVLQKTIYLYTIGQPRFVKHAIAFTLLNRYKANRPEFGGHSIRDICLQFSENAQPEEFYIPEHKQIEMNKWLTKIWNDKSMYDPSKGALYFRFPDENVVWIEGMVKTTEINKIEFYKD
ncbi:hypothetical protein PMAYCL1PPCAC_21347, partial [Pristionchus mayeri]